MRILLHALALCLLLLPPALARTPFAPFDQASRDSSFLAFRTKLLDIVEREDAAALLARVDEEILFSFGNEAGINGFIAAWSLKKKESGLWRELKKVLRLGGSFSQGEFIAPYVFSGWPDDLDAFDHVAVITSGLRIRAAPSTGSPVTGTASYEILKRDFQAADAPDWISVLTPAGERGYVFARYVRSPVDYRAVFHLIDGEWKLRAFVAGD